LNPEKFTLYTKETTKDLILNYKLLPDGEGEISVYDMFCDNNYNTNKGPNELVYALLQRSL
jgi:hypothetical protein